MPIVFTLRFKKVCFTVSNSTEMKEVFFLTVLRSIRSSNAHNMKEIMLLISVITWRDDCIDIAL